MKLILVTSLCIASCAVYSQASKKIAYSDSGPFNWSMFKGKANIDHINEFGQHTAAVTVSTISYSSELHGHQAKINITALFNPQESWTIYPHLEHPDEALNHEKRHFQICEIYARKFRQTVSKTHFTSKNFHSEMQNIFNKITAEYRAEQKQYDLETEHSLNLQQQEIWNEKIDKELKVLSVYNKSDFTITLN